MKKRFSTSEFQNKHAPTVSAEVSALTFQTEFGVTSFNVWDTAGEEALSGLGDGYYTGAHGCIIMFDVSSRLTLKSITRWYRDGTEINKVDIKERAIKPKIIVFHRTKNIEYCDISVKATYNIEKPFFLLSRIFTGDSDLEFDPAPTFGTPEAEIDAISEYKDDDDDS
ncbi:hypothetical protein DASC09_031240 [Saccharomycopsis crataegensis]|uniref:Uncharacterized protein n=1 Tax=Saccharomycopsis crataegensis TaxID=43959 RepID=A0AAV5QM41_9ASCO|nr:hypothetical protein DASC09_031240 [Saccharomycopsis crataegensis]